jgi:hypothetical protein
MEDFGLYLGLAGLVGFFGLVYGVPVWQAMRRPQSDIARIKRSLDGEAHRIVGITRLGSDWEIVGRSLATYRKFAVTIEYPDGTRRNRTIDLEPSLLGDERLHEIRNGSRRPLVD